MQPARDGTSEQQWLERMLRRHFRFMILDYTGRCHDMIRSAPVVLEFPPGLPLRIGGSVLAHNVHATSQEPYSLGPMDVTELDLACYRPSRARRTTAATLATIEGETQMVRKLAVLALAVVGLVVASTGCEPANDEVVVEVVQQQ